MNGLLIFLVAFGLGFFAAIPPGGCQIEVAKRAIQGHLFAARMVILGSAFADVLYGSVALFEIAPYLELPWVLTSLNLVGALILWILAYLTIKESKKPHDLHLEKIEFRSDRFAFLTGFSLGFSNPAIIFTWLFGVAIAKNLGLASPFTTPLKVIFIAGGSFGLSAYTNIIIGIIHRMKHLFSTKSMGKIYYWFGVMLFISSFYFIYGLFH